MSRHGYVNDGDWDNNSNLYRGTVAMSIRSKRGQAFLVDLAEAMDAMPDKVLIAGELIDEEGNCCAIGAVCKSRVIDVTKIDYGDQELVGKAVGIARQMVAEIEYENDDGGWYETDEQRWRRMRQWVERNIVHQTKSATSGEEGK